VAPPGFINIHLAPAWLAAQVDAILSQGARYGAVDLGHGQAAQVEYVSANPTGPLHVGTGRGAALGDSLARVLQWAGYRVDREYYVNDAGSRMEAFNASVFARYAQHFGIDARVPEDGYPGDYVRELAEAIAGSDGPRFLDQATAEEWDKVEVDRASRGATDGSASGSFLEAGRKGMDLLLEQIRHDLDRMNVRFDRWFSEQSLFDEGAVKRAIDALRDRGYVVEREGAIWFNSTALGDDRDSVLVRSNGLPTYFASDVAYHYNKLIERGYDLAIDIWGADHQGHVPRMKAVVGAIGGDPSHLTILLYQLVNLVRNGRPKLRSPRRARGRNPRDTHLPEAARLFQSAGRIARRHSR
jgi:arginyl-tRNA synthetase